ncbi:aminodeoxychorismate synthase component I [Pseudarthrobacter sp. lyk4-40-TYG-27]|uniref:aminodeoxychorismate synthase component I n=1 Tax=Pseudarthrobacter sp. lyk4-40-TYG-27 TaxID=3040305 RepID=UPI0025550692|nr:aminodeoxychorismate synthase component I [Pseudarthrobacter sp. lyk4-40-TYG-27]
MSPAPVIIAIDGRSGAGKTTLAVELAALLRAHHKVSLFHLEDIYPGWDGLAAGVERYVSTVLTPLSLGEAATWTSWDWANHYDGDARVTLPAEIVIVEGVGAASEPARPFLNAVIWAEAPDDVRRTRALDRDGDTYRPFWDRWAAQEEEWLGRDNVPGRADLRVNNRADGSAPADLLRLLPYLPALAPVLAPELSARRGLRLHAERLDLAPDAPALFESLYGRSPNAVWLDSSNHRDAPAAPGQPASGPQASGPQASGPQDRTAAERSRFSIMADDAGTFGQYVTHRAGVGFISAGSSVAKVPGPFFRWLNTVWGRRAVRTPEGYPGEFTLGWLGCLGYELKRETGGSDLSAPTPDAALIFAGRAVVLDHAEGTAWLLALAAPDADEWLDRARAAVQAAASAATTPAGPAGAVGTGAVGAGDAGGSTGVGRPGPPVFRSRDTGARYRAKIAAAQHEIAQGNTYEVCLTTTLEARIPAETLDPWATYLALRRRSPAPFASYLRLGGLSVASTSPERFLKIAADGGMRAEPIKGTRRRAADPQEDSQLRADLATSVKDRAENIMIVDLLRNDLSHFAVPGSVTVSRLCAIESYATVHQMVSTIDARLLPGAARAEAVAACFPAGSMTGAPKISTMAILDRLEAGPRGFYSGAIGYFSLNSATDLAVAIRTLVIDASGDGAADLTLGVGGAITSDSDPDDEYDEIRTKAFGVLSTLGSDFPVD